MKVAREASAPAGTISSGGPSRWLSDLRPVWLTVATLDLIAVAVLLVPGNPILELRRHQLLGMVLSHAGVLFLILGCYGERRRWLEAVARWSPSYRNAVFVLGTALPLAGLVLVASLWPGYASELLKEWGLVEALHVALFLVAAWVASAHAGLLRSRGGPYRPYRLMSVLCLFLVVEELDYFGIIGGPLGRIDGVYVGAFHDLLNLAEHFPVVWVGLGALVIVLLAALRWAGYVTGGFLRAEALDATSVPLYLAALALGMAQLVDMKGDLLAPLGGVFHYRIEEPLELLGALLVNVGLLQKYARDRRAEGVG